MSNGLKQDKIKMRRKSLLLLSICCVFLSSKSGLSQDTMSRYVGNEIGKAIKNSIEEFDARRMREKEKEREKQKEYWEKQEEMRRMDAEKEIEKQKRHDELYITNLQEGNEAKRKMVLSGEISVAEHNLRTHILGEHNYVSLFSEEGDEILLYLTFDYSHSIILGVRSFDTKVHGVKFGNVMIKMKYYDPYEKKDKFTNYWSKGYVLTNPNSSHEIRLPVVFPDFPSSYNSTDMHDMLIYLLDTEVKTF